MANWTTLKEAIANIIKTNGNQEITGQVLQNTLNGIINAIGENATFISIASPDTNPGTPDGPVFYLAPYPGTYANFSGIEVGDEVSILKWNNGTWDKIPTNIAAGNSVYYEYLANSGKDYPIIYAEDIPESNSVRKAINSLLLKAKIVRSNDRPNVKVQLCYINRTSTTEGQFDNAIQLHIWEGDSYKGIKIYKNPAMVIGTTGVKDISFYDSVYKFELILTLDLDKSTNIVRWNETTNVMYQKTPFDDLCYELLDKNVNDYVSSNSSKYFGYDINSGKDYPMEFTDDAPPRDGSAGSTLGLYLNNVLKNIRVFTEDIEKANKWSYELSYINRTVSHTGVFPNTLGFTRRNRETKAIDTTFYAQKLDALLNGDTDFEYIWEIDGDIVIFTLDCSKAPVGTPLTISNYPLSEKPNTYSERQWLNKKQYFYMGKIPKITGIVNPMSVLNVSVEGEIVYIASKISRTTDIIYQFQKCMFNSLFTFYRVGFVENSSAYPNALNRNSVTWVNIASSDNIGPMYIRDAGWCGANHSWKEKGVVHTAKNDSFAIYSNGKILQDGDNIFTDNAEIRVENTIYNPAIAPEDEEATILTSPLCTESVVYRVSGNSIQVILNHKFVNEEAVTIAKYYGMQSMFIGEDKILTSNGKYPNWANVVEDGMSFNKAGYPKFNRFVEHNSSNDTYQSTYLRPYGLGDHSQIGSSSFMFIKSGAKAYHYLIDSIQYSSGMSHNWSGLYSWFKQPILDDDNFFVYEGKIDGHDLVFIDIKMLSSATKIKLPDKYVLKDFTIIQKDDVVTIGENIDIDGLEISSTNSGSVILKF